MKSKKQQKIASFSLIKKHKITAVMLSKWFGYNSPNTLRNSTAYESMLQGVEELISYLEKEKPV